MASLVKNLTPLLIERESLATTGFDEGGGEEREMSVFGLLGVFWW